MRTHKNARAVIVKNGKIVLIHRKKEGKEYWVTPGGGVEEGESLLEAVVREVWEETSQKVTKCVRISEVEEDELTTFYFKCDVTGGELKLIGPESNPIGDNWYNPEWVEISELKNITYYPVNLLDLIK